MDYTSIIEGIVAGVVAAGVFAGLESLKKRKFDTQEATLCIADFCLLNREGIELRLLHAWEDNRACINRVYTANRCGDHWKVKVRHAKGLGFQYEWFIQYKEEQWTSDEIILKLKSNGYCQATEGEGMPCPAWFVNPERPDAKDLLEEEICNNRV